MWVDKEEFNKLREDSMRLKSIEFFLGKPPENFKGSVFDLMVSKFRLIEKALNINGSTPEGFTKFEWILLKILEAVKYRDTYFRKVDSSLTDPFLDTIRELMPDEIETIRQRSMDMMNGNSTHSICGVTNLCLISTLVRQNKADGEELQKQMSSLQTTN